MPQLPKSSDHLTNAQPRDGGTATNSQIIKALQQSATAAIDTSTDDGAPSEEPRVLSPEAQRALAEAVERRVAREAAANATPKEIGGRNGPDPVRYGDWESGGIAWDF